MCGCLKLEGLSRKLGDLVSGVDTRSGAKIQGRWAGAARSESISFWKKEGEATVVRIQANTFIEGKKKLEFDLRDSQIIGIQVHKEVIASDGRIVAKPGDIKIITRPPITKFEQDIHNRWPVAIVSGISNPRSFNENSIIPY